eukprot:m.47452 g.47452  ORF g.47452 m.47452 type:complete len:946 (-) comp10503_c0_seq1:149-2986(-)
MHISVMFLLSFATVSVLGGCPPAPQNFTMYPGNCIGLHPDGQTCAPAIHTGENCGNISTCYEAAMKACEADSKCYSFALESEHSGTTCGTPSGRWHTYAYGAKSLLQNNDWVTYAKGSGPPPPPSFDVTALICMVRGLALQASEKKLGVTSQYVYDALQLQNCPGHNFGTFESYPHKQEYFQQGNISIYVSAATGSDTTGHGTLGNPFASLHKARDYIRNMQQQRDTEHKATVFVENGRYEFGALGALTLDERDSYVTWVSTGSEMSTLSGGISLSNFSWKPISKSEESLLNVPENSVFVADLTKLGKISFSSLFRAGSRQTSERLVRARAPNGNPELPSGQCVCHGQCDQRSCGNSFFNATTPLSSFVAPTINEINFPVPKGGIVYGDDLYSNYSVLFQAPPEGTEGLGLPVAVCPRTGPGLGQGDLYNRTSSVQWVKGNRNWTNVDKAVAHIYQNGWGNTQYAIKAIDWSSGIINFSYGGWQQGRSGRSGPFWIENIFEELNEPSEWYYQEDTQMLYVWPNATTMEGKMDILKNLSIAVLESVIVVNGTVANPATNIEFVGFEITETSPTFLNAYERPPSGDWAIHRGGTVFIQGASDINLINCSITRAGGNGVIYSRHAKNCTLTGSEIYRSGDSGVVLYGDLNWKTGDATGDNGNEYPSGIVIKNNLIHEVGVYGKQTACIFQGVSGRNTIADNVCFSSPRSLININDGFMGLTNITGNVLFNPCRESDDHGALNCWDRTPMRHLSDDTHGDPTWTPGWTTITKNLVLNSYGGSHNLDFDDGSEYMNATGNVVAFAECCKGNYGSNRKCNNNLIITPGVDGYSGSVGHGFCSEETNNGKGSTKANKEFENNTCVLLGHGSVSPYRFQSCDATKNNFNTTCWTTQGNTYMVANGTQVQVPCKGGSIDINTWSQKYHQDLGHKVENLPTINQLETSAKTVLDL